MARCEVCGEREAAYVCRRCSRRVCPDCFEPYSWLCKLCYEPLHKRVEYGAFTPSATSMLPKVLFIAGLAMIFLGMIVMLMVPLLLEQAGIQGSGGFIVFIGPFPIAFGAGPHGSHLIIAGVIIALAMLAFIWLYKPWTTR